MIGGEDMT